MQILLQTKHPFMVATFVASIALSPVAHGQVFSAKGIQASNNAAELSLASDMEKLNQKVKVLTESTLPDLEKELYQIHEKLNNNKASIHTLQQTLLTPQPNSGLNLEGLVRQIAELSARVSQLEAALATAKAKELQTK